MCDEADLLVCAVGKDATQKAAPEQVASQIEEASKSSEGDQSPFLLALPPFGPSVAAPGCC